jgi:hypothetical protein
MTAKSFEPVGADEARVRSVRSAGGWRMRRHLP